VSTEDLCTGLAGCTQHPDGLGLDGHTRSVDGVCVHCGSLWLACECPDIVIETDDVAAAESRGRAAGWREAIEALRDVAAVVPWVKASDGNLPEAIATYLESLAPKETP